MAIVTKSATRAFVRSAKFPKAPTRAKSRAFAAELPIQLKQGDAQSLVVAGSLVIAGENVPVRTREDLVNCMLFAQLAASGEVEDPTMVNEWYAAYFRALTALGWAQSGTEFRDYDFSAVNAEAHEAIIPVLTTILGAGAPALAAVKVAIDALKTMEENAPWIKLFDQQSRTERSAHFQVATAHVGDDGLLQTALVAFELKSRASLTQVLFFKFSSSSTKLRYSAGRATIYEAALNEQRDAITKRLVDYRAAYVRQVKFPPLPASATTFRRALTAAPRLARRRLRVS